MLPIGLLPACGTDDKKTGENEEAAAQVWRGASADHLVMGASDTGEGELTDVDFFPDCQFAALTRTGPCRMPWTSRRTGAGPWWPMSVTPWPSPVHQPGRPDELPDVGRGGPSPAAE